MIDLTESAIPEQYLVSAADGSRAMQLVAKRAFDIAISLVMILIVLPVLLAAALAIRCSSRGPVFFRQKRWGWQDSHFVCLKFRTMHVDQEKFIASAKLQRLQEKGILFKPKNDPRVTRLGAFLRKTSIDELPQLFNVLAGDMSLVGPRPLMPHMLEPYPELRKIRGQMRPGITGLWQTSARENNDSALQMAQYDLAYIRDFSFWMDLKIIFHTPVAVLFGKGAY